MPLQERTKLCIEEHRHDAWERQEAIDGLLADHGLKSSDLLWAIRPYLPHLISRGPLMRTINQPSSVSLPQRRRFHLPLPNAVLPKKLETERLLRFVIGQRLFLYGHFDGTTFRAWLTENQRVALGGPEPNYAIYSRARILGDRKARNMREAIDFGRLAGLLGSDQEALKSQFERLDRVREQLASFLDNAQPKTVLVASTHDKVLRVLLRESHLRGIATAYVPHAPTSLARTYADLPVHTALLRGHGDVDYYEWIGARRSAISVVGDPSLLRDSPPRLSRPVVAFTTNPYGTVESLVNYLSTLKSVTDARNVPLVVAPHPRGASRAAQAAAKLDLPVNASRTSRLLATGQVEALVSETSSGVLLESIHYGIPSVSLGRTANYAFICDLGVPINLSPSELVTFLEFALSRTDRASREEDTDYPSRWLHATGDSAKTRLLDAVQGLSSSNQLVNDTWSMPVDSERT